MLTQLKQQLTDAQDHVLNRQKLICKITEELGTFIKQMHILSSRSCQKTPLTSCAIYSKNAYLKAFTVLNKSSVMIERVYWE